MMNILSNKKIQWIIAIVAPLLFLVMPNTELFTPALAKFFCVTLIGILALLFELTEPAIVGLYFIFAYTMTGIVPLADALGTFGSGIVMQTICCFLIVEVVGNTKLLDRLAYNLILVTGGSYIGIFLGLSLIGIVFSILIPSATVSMIVLFIGLGIIKGLDITPKSNMAAGIIVMSGMAVACAQHYLYSATGVGVPLSMLEGVFEGFKISYLEIIFHNLIMIPEIFIVGFILSKLFKPEKEINSKEYFRGKLAELGAWTTEEKKVIVVLIATFLFFVTNKWHGMDMTFGFLGACILFYLPFINVGKKENIQKVNVSVLLIMVGCMLIGSAGAACGIKEFITGIIAPLLQSENSFLFVAMTWISGVLANMMMTPLALMTTLTIPLAEIGQSIGINPAVVAYTLSHCADYVFFPYESTSFLILYGLGMMNMKQFIKSATTLTIVGGILTVVLGGIYWMAIGLI